MKYFDTMDTERRSKTFKAMRIYSKALLNAYNERTADTPPEETVKRVISLIGYEATKVTIAEAVNAIGDWDKRISATTKEWAENVNYAASNEEQQRFGTTQYSSQIHSCHIEQLAKSMMVIENCYTEPKRKVVKYPAGARVELVTDLHDPFEVLSKGLKGTVVYTDDIGTVHVHWDNGSNLGALCGIDQLKVL